MLHLSESLILLFFFFKHFLIRNIFPKLDTVILFPPTSIFGVVIYLQKQLRRVAGVVTQCVRSGTHHTGMRAHYPEPLPSLQRHTNAAHLGRKKTAQGLGTMSLRWQTYMEFYTLIFGLAKHENI